MQVKLLSGALGAEIDGINLKDISAKNFKVINNLLLEHKFLFLRNQHITSEEQIALAKCFGSLERHVYVKKIIDMEKKESDEILSKVFAHQERLDFTCRCQWTKNAVAIWDNRSVIHQGLTDFFPCRGLGYERIMDRIAIESDRPN
jgi:alpha-ketoglutarate-dependent taurine dioxygenase